MISDSYKKILVDIHESSPFGKRRKMPRYSEKYIRLLKPKSILDFGCGKGKLLDTLTEMFPDIEVTGYDPGNKKYDISLDNIFVDLLMSSDVLEHIEPEHLDKTLEYLSTKSKYIYHLIALSPAKLILPDGRNAHLIQESPDWWRSKFVNLKYRILFEEYKTGIKFSQELKKNLPVEKYFIVAEKI
jgi:SAM-dependent methyltransferase